MYLAFQIALTRLRGCTGWSAPLLFASNKIMVYLNEAHKFLKPRLPGLRLATCLETNALAPEKIFNYTYENPSENYKKRLKRLKKRLEKENVKKERKEKKKRIESEVSDGLPTDAYSRALSHYCLTRELLPAVFPPWADTFLLRQPGPPGLPREDHIDAKLSADARST